MKTKNINICIYIAILCICFTFMCCGSKSNNAEVAVGNESEEIKQTPIDLPLNISIYLDLSDRLKRNLTPSQKERDTAIVG